MLQKIILGTLLVIWLIIIFMFSNQTADKSTGVSDKFVSSITNILNIKNKDEEISIIVRKTAHFMEYFILGILLFLNLRLYNLDNKLIIGIIFCFIYAVSDEVHQIFIDGRTPKLLDIFIDTLGASLSLFILSLIKP